MPSSKFSLKPRHRWPLTAAAVTACSLLLFVCGPAIAQCPGGGTDGGLWKVNAAAAMVGECGLEVVIVDQSADQSFVRDLSPEGETEFWARVYLDPNSLNLTTRSAIKIFEFKSSAATSVSTNKSSFFISLRKTGSGYQLGPRIVKNNGVYLPANLNEGWDRWLTISDGPHWFEVHWYRGSTPTKTDGGFELWIDGVLVGARSNTANGERVIDYTQMGVFSRQIAAGSGGSIYFDEFTSALLGPIGPAS